MQHLKINSTNIYDFLKFTELLEVLRKFEILTKSGILLIVKSHQNSF